MRIGDPAFNWRSVGALELHALNLAQRNFFGECIVHARELSFVRPVDVG
jgi:hypothetical protein